MKNQKPLKAFSLIELGIVVLIIGVVTLVALNGKSLLKKADCVKKNLSSDKITNLSADNVGSNLKDVGSSAYENCVNSDGSTTSSTPGTCSGTTCTSCKTLLAANPGTASGTYTIDPDGAGSTPSFQAYCDMDSDGGGWTLVLRSLSSSGTDFAYNSSLWNGTGNLNPSSLPKSSSDLFTGTTNSLYNSYYISGLEFRLVIENNEGEILITVPTANTAKYYSNNQFIDKFYGSFSPLNGDSGCDWKSKLGMGTNNSSWPIQRASAAKGTNIGSTNIRWGIIAENTKVSSCCSVWDSAVGIGVVV